MDPLGSHRDLAGTGDTLSFHYTKLSVIITTSLIEIGFDVNETLPLLSQRRFFLSLLQFQNFPCNIFAGLITLILPDFFPMINPSPVVYYGAGRWNYRLIKI